MSKLEKVAEELRILRRRADELDAEFKQLNERVHEVNNKRNAVRQEITYAQERLIEAAEG